MSNPLPPPLPTPPPHHSALEDAGVVVVAVIAGIVGLIGIAVFYKDAFTIAMCVVLAAAILGVIELQNRRKRAKGLLPPRHRR